MADYFVASGGSNTSPYDTWAKAATSLATAIAAATVDGDRVIIQYDGVPSTDSAAAADTTYTAAAAISIISASNNGGSSWTPTVMTNIIGHSSASRQMSFNSASNKPLFIYGIQIDSGSTTAKQCGFGVAGDNQIINTDSCIVGVSNSSASTLALGGSGTNLNSVQRHVNLTFKPKNVGSKVRLNSICELINFSVNTTSATPTGGLFIINASGPSGAYTTISGSDLSSLGSNALIGDCSVVALRVNFDNCKLGSGFTVFASQTSSAGPQALFSNCATGDTHFEFAYHDSLGSLTAVTSPYFTTGAKYDGTNAVCWKIVTTSLASYASPFITPWIEKYHSGTSAITPYLEILRNDSTTAFNNDEVWGEFSAQATSGSVLPVFKNDRRALEASAAAQASGAGLASWTGEGGSAWSGKIDSGSSVTPAEIGMLRARVCVGLASATVYIDPYIRT